MAFDDKSNEGDKLLASIEHEYIVFMTDDIIERFTVDARVLAACTRTGCTVELTGRTLNKRVGFYKWVKYCIIRVTAMNEKSIKKCNKLIEMYFPEYLKRKRYYRNAELTLYRGFFNPDNTELYYSFQRTGKLCYGRSNFQPGPKNPGPNIPPSAYGTSFNNAKDNSIEAPKGFEKQEQLSRQINNLHNFSNHIDHYTPEYGNGDQHYNHHAKHHNKHHAKHLVNHNDMYHEPYGYDQAHVHPHGQQNQREHKYIEHLHHCKNKQQMPMSHHTYEYDHPPHYDQGRDYDNAYNGYPEEPQVNDDSYYENHFQPQRKVRQSYSPACSIIDDHLFAILAQEFGCDSEDDEDLFSFEDLKFKDKNIENQLANVLPLVY